MLEVASLGSGSSGNATLVRSATTTLLVDCGFTLKESLKRMASLGVAPSDLTAVLISHEHGDHVKGIGPLSRKFGVPIYLTHGTFGRLRDNRLINYELFHAHAPFNLGDIEVDPFPTPHDAAESCQFVLRHDGVSFVVATDMGVCTPFILEKLAGVNGVLIECNYDDDMLRNGPYPPSLQHRIRGKFGHLGNVQAGPVVRAIDHPALQTILLGHLSEKNNTEKCARDAVLASVPNAASKVEVLKQHAASRWYAITAQEIDVPDASDVSQDDVDQTNRI